MSFTNPLGWLLSLILPLIILIHFKRHQVVQREVSYLGLWDEVIEEIQGIKTNKINKYLQLLLQLLIGMLIVMAFAGPIWINSFKGDKLTIALDTSLTMMAKENGDYRIEMAKEEIKNYVEKIEDDVSIDFVTLREKCEKIVENGDKDSILNRLIHIEATYEALNTKNTEAILSTCSKPIVLFSDKNIGLGDKQIKIGDRLDNIGIIDGNYDYYSNTALFRIKNYGEKNTTLLLELKDENSWCDIQKVNIHSNEIMDVNWTNIPVNTKVLKMAIKKEDMLSMDNEFTLPIDDKYKKKVLMIGENYFLRKALQSIPYIKLEIINNYEDIKDSFDLYIINHDIKKDKIPAHKKAWYLKPDENMIEGYFNDYGELEIIDEMFSKDIELREAYIKDYPYLKIDNNLQSILKADGKAVMGYRIEDTTKEIYSTIDFDKTNLSMKSDFPIIVENIIKWFLKEDKNQYETEEEMFIEKTNTFYSNTATKLDLKKATIILLLILMALEWEVYRRGI